MTDEAITPPENKTVQDTDIWNAIQAYNQFVSEMDQFMVLMKTAIGISTAKLHRALTVLNEKVPMPEANKETLRRVFEELAEGEFETEIDGVEDAEVTDD